MTIHSPSSSSRLAFKNAVFTSRVAPSQSISAAFFTMTRKAVLSAPPE